MRSTKNQITIEQQKSTINAKEAIESLEEVMMDLGQVRAFDFVSKLLTVSNLRTLQNIKESKSYKGLTYRDTENKLLTVSSWDEFCTYKLQVSRSTIDNNLLNFNQFGEEFFEASQRIGLGTRELRKLRQLPSETQELIINDEAVDLKDKEAVKELIEDYTFRHLTEKAEMQKQLDEANQTIEAVRENSAAKQQELDEVKEREAKRKFSQEPWKHEVLERVNGLAEASTMITVAVNQIKDIFEDLNNNNETLDQKSVEYIRRCLLSECKSNQELVFEVTNDILGAISLPPAPDLFIGDVYNELLESNTSDN